MPEPGREGKAPTEMQGLTWGISWGWEPPGLAGMRAMLVSMETQQKMCFHRGAASEAGWTSGWPLVPILVAQGGERRAEGTRGPALG